MTRAPAPPSYRSLLRPAFLTAAASLVAFGLAHAAFITWAVDRSEGPGLAIRLLVMFAAPAGFGVPFAIVAALLGAGAWRATSRTRMRSWAYGAILASALAAPIALSAAHGPYGDSFPSGPVLAAVFGSIVALPALLGLLVARSPRGLVMGLAPAPLVFPWTGFLMGGGFVGWTIPFVVSLLLILLGSGWLMGRLAPAPEAFSPEAISSEA